MPATAGRGFILRWVVSLVFVLGWSQTGWALNCQEVRQLTLLYFKMHYSYNSFDQELGARTLDTFIKAWDPAKLYFYQADVDEFTKKYGSNLHKMINQADCSAIDDIMARYSRRFEERQKVIFKQIDDKHDFTKDEYMVIDTKNTPWAKNVEDLNERWRQRVKFQLLTLKTSLEDQTKAREKLKKRFELSQRRHNELNKDKVYGVFMNAFSTSLDPHSSYMPSDELEDFRIRTRLSLEGIGASLRSEDGFTIVVSLVKGGAAEKSGALKIGDKIIAVAQGDAEPVDVIDMELQEVVKLIRGARGTTVKLTIMRKEAQATEKRVVAITREKIQLEDQQASSKVVPVEVSDGKGTKKLKIGVLKLPSFYIDFEGRHKQLKNYRSSSQDTKRELAKLQKEKVDAVVMDLRNNGGGSLEESINMAGLFFDKGPVVQVKAQNGQTEAYYDRDGETSYKGPLVVVINRHSASASEIFAGAIQDYERGLLVGDSHTFGKGTVQNLNDVAARLGAVKVTVNKFYRASGASTQLEGVSSDIRLPSVVDELEIGEKYYDYALPFETIRNVEHQEFGAVKPYLGKLKARSDERVAKDAKFKEISDEITKYRKNEKERNRVSLQEKKGDKKAEGEVEEAEMEEPAEQTLVEDTYLQEAVRIATDYAQLMQKKDLGAMTIPEVAAAEKKGKKEVKVSKTKDANPLPGKKGEDKETNSKELIK